MVCPQLSAGASLGSESDVVEGVALGCVEGGAGHAEDLVQHVRDGAELVKLHRQLALQMRDHHPQLSVHWLQWLQLQLALRGGRRDSTRIIGTSCLESTHVLPSKTFTSVNSLLSQAAVVESKPLPSSAQHCLF